MITSASSASNRSQCSTTTSKKHQYLKGNSILNKSKLNISSISTIQSDTPQFSPRSKICPNYSHRFTQDNSLRVLNSRILNEYTNGGHFQQLNKSVLIKSTKQNKAQEVDTKNNQQSKTKVALSQDKLQPPNNLQQDIQVTPISIKRDPKLIKVEDEQGHVIKYPYSFIDTLNEHLQQGVVSQKQLNTSAQQIQNLSEQCDILKEQLIKSRDTVSWLEQQLHSQTLNLQKPQGTKSPKSQQKAQPINVTHDLTQSHYNAQMTQLSRQNMILTNQIRQFEANELNYEKMINTKLKIFQDKENTMKVRIIQIEKLLKDKLNDQVQNCLIQEYAGKLAAVQDQLKNQSMMIDQLQQPDKTNHLKIKVEYLQQNIVKQRQQIDDLISVNNQQQQEKLRILERNETENLISNSNLKIEIKRLRMLNYRIKNNILDDEFNQMQQRVEKNNTKVDFLQIQAETINFNQLDEQVAEVEKEALNLQGDLDMMSEDFNQTMIDRLMEFQGQAFDLGNFIDEQL